MLTRSVQPIIRLVVGQQFRALSAQRFNSSHSLHSSPGIHQVSPATTPSSEQCYLTDERKRQLITLYHRSENFVTLQNLSEYIDREFDRVVTKVASGHADFLQVEDDQIVLEADLRRRERYPKYYVSSEGGAGELENETHSDFRKLGSRHRDLARAARLKAAVYKVDETMKAGLEMVEKYRRSGSVDVFERPSE